MKFGNREKIIGVSVVALGLIGGLHFLVFAPKANEYQEAVMAYNTSVTQLTSVGQPPPEQEITEFQDRTWDYQRRLLDFIRDANLIIPAGFPIPVAEVAATASAEVEGADDSYIPDEPPPSMGMMGPWGMGPGIGGMGMGQGGAQAQSLPEKEYDPLTPEQKRVLAAKLADLERLRDQGAPTRMSFMDAENQWNILRQLPDAIRLGNVDVADLVRRLEGTDAIIKQAGQGSQLRYNRQIQYMRELREIGLDQVRRQGLSPGAQPNRLINSRLVASITRDYGNLAAVLHTINRLNLIQAAVPRESLNITTDQEYFARLEDLLRLDAYREADRASDITYIKWQMVAYDALKQLDALVDILQIARQASVLEVASVKFWEPLDVEFIDPAAAPAAADPSMGGMGANPWGMDPSMMGMGMDPGMMGGDPFMMGGMGGSMWGGMGMQPAGPTGEVVGTSTPIEIEVRGTNASVMEFIHVVTHSRRLYSIESLVITAPVGQANYEVSARVVIHAMSRLKNPRFQMTQAQFDAREAEMTGGGSDMAAGTNGGAEFVDDPSAIAP